MHKIKGLALRALAADKKKWVWFAKNNIAVAHLSLHFLNFVSHMIQFRSDPDNF